MEAADGGLRALHATAFPRLVAAVLLAGGLTRPDAEDVAQEAFVRLVPRWSKVSRYDDPEAWLRRVALNIASNRRRSLRNGLRAPARHGAPMPAVEPDVTMDVRRALLSVAPDQRLVLVLHHCGDAVVRLCGGSTPVHPRSGRRARLRARAADGIPLRAPLPAEARPTGYASGRFELWFAASDPEAAWLVNSTDSADTERWPEAVDLGGCA